MIYPQRKYRSFAAGVTLLLFAVSCTPSIAPYSETAYSQAVGLKVESLRLMGNAETPFENYTRRVRDLELELDKAYEFARGRPRNEFSTRQWELLLDPDRNLLAGFLRRWENSETLSTPFIVEASDIVSQAFDTIIGLESGKIQAGDQL
jgi:hypothetical protein